MQRGGKVKTTGLQVDRPGACTANQRWGDEIQQLVAWRMSFVVIPFVYVTAGFECFAALTKVWLITGHSLHRHSVNALFLSAEPSMLRLPGSGISALAAHGIATQHLA